MSTWLEELSPRPGTLHILEGRRLDEVECIIPDIPGHRTRQASARDEIGVRSISPSRQHLLPDHYRANGRCRRC